jgi:hypothetical protein
MANSQPTCLRSYALDIQRNVRSNLDFSAIMFRKCLRSTNLSAETQIEVRMSLTEQTRRVPASTIAGSALLLPRPLDLCIRRNMALLLFPEKPVGLAKRSWNKADWTHRVAFCDIHVRPELHCKFPPIIRYSEESIQKIFLV